MIPILRIGRPGKAPDGYRELPGGVHLGKGVWILRYEPINPPTPSVVSTPGSREEKV